ncbi:hypothetical protein [Methanospirillum lacunae]|uniref:Uncharacterized protein n=1 Tax=Methanospirillum lacunae TaxID=668570 RepID=A0A2V2MYJ5_9EURY|nr:hypothetical protein [Methanospirillum lacunae]PWR71350.1 hypothetical protein DK846_10820 [Methanospirillum lacunae]
MEIVSVRTQPVLSDGRVKTEYLLSSPVTREVLYALSQGSYENTGWQYLSPTYCISNHEGLQISGILKSPVIVVESLPEISIGIEDYFHGFLSTIPDSEKPDWYPLVLIQKSIQYLKHIFLRHK